MEPKNLTCMDEELCIEIAKPKDKAQEMIITISLTRTYLIADPLEVISENGDRAGVAAQLSHSFAI